MLLEENNSSYIKHFEERERGNKQSPQRKITYENLIKHLGKCQSLEIWLGSLRVIFIY